MRRLAFALFVTGMTLVSGRADAQPAPWAPERLTAGWTFLPAITLGAMWDSNVTVQNAGGTGANATIAEWVGVVSPRGEFVFNGRHTRFNAGYAGTLERYDRLAELNRFEQRGRVTLRHDVTQRFQLQAMGSVTRTPTSDRLELGAVPFVHVGSRLIEAGGGSSYAISDRTKLQASYRFQKVDFDRSITEDDRLFLTGGYAHMPEVSVLHDVTSRFSTGASYEFRRAVTAGGASGFNAESALGDVRYKLTENTTIAGAAGASYVDIDHSKVGEWGPAFRASLEHREGLTEVSARYEKAFIPTFSFGGLTGNQFASLSAATPLTRGGRLMLNGTAAYSKTEPLDAIGFTIRLNTYWVSGGVGYQVSRWLRADSFVSTNFQRSSARGDINRTRIGVQFTTSKPVRIQ